MHIFIIWRNHNEEFPRHTEIVRLFSFGDGCVISTDGAKIRKTLPS